VLRYGLPFLDTWATTAWIPESSITLGFDPCVVPVFGLDSLGAAMSVPRDYSTQWISAPASSSSVANGSTNLLIYNVDTRYYIGLRKS
jgi:hypothetical protein